MDEEMQLNEDYEYISLTNDLLFHMVFTRNQKALKGLLSSLLNIPYHDILHVEILNPVQYSDMSDSRMTVLDLKLHLNDQQFILVEMQVRPFEKWTNRTLAYACRQVADQVHGTFDYGKMQPVILISIMDHTLFKDHRRFFTRYELRDEEGYPYSNMLQFYVMDLTAAAEATDEEKQQGLLAWANAFRADSWQDVKCIENPWVKEATRTMQGIMADQYERQLIRMRQDAEIDRRTIEREYERKIAQARQEEERARRETEKAQRETEKARRETEQARQETANAMQQAAAILHAMAGLVQKGVLSAEEAAGMAGLSLEDFVLRAGISDP